jgi:tripartite-type tricarboxylate transporter receptor subunit TctC
VSGDRRHPSVPDVPTFAEGGVQNFDVRLWYAVLAPAGTPKDIVDKLSRQIADVLATPEFKATLAKRGLTRWSRRRSSSRR